MPYPPIPQPQTRSEQMKLLQTDGLASHFFIPIIAVPARAYGRQTATTSKLFVPALWPIPFLPYLSPVHIDVQKNPALALLMGLLQMEDRRCQFHPHLVTPYWLDQINQEHEIYLWPDAPPDDLICEQCGGVTPYQLGDTFPNGCLACGTTFVRHVDPEEGARFDIPHIRQLYHRQFYP